MRKRIIISVAVAFFAVCTLLTGCGENNSATPDSASGKTEETTAAASTAAPTTEAPTTLPPTTAHVHQWEDITTKIHHDAVKEQVWVVDKPAETLQCTRTTLTCSYPDCQELNVKFVLDTGENSDYYNSMVRNSEEHMQNHITKIEKINSEALRKKELYGYPTVALIAYPHYDEHIEYYQKNVPEEGHYETQTTKEAYDETVITGQRCKTCREYKLMETKPRN